MQRSQRQSNNSNADKESSVKLFALLQLTMHIIGERVGQLEYVELSTVMILHSIVSSEQRPR